MKLIIYLAITILILFSNLINSLLKNNKKKSLNKTEKKKFLESEKQAKNKVKKHNKIHSKRTNQDFEVINEDNETQGSPDIQAVEIYDESHGGLSEFTDSS